MAFPTMDNKNGNPTHCNEPGSFGSPQPLVKADEAPPKAENNVLDVAERLKLVLDIILAKTNTSVKPFGGGNVADVQTLAQQGHFLTRLVQLAGMALVGVLAFTHWVNLLLIAIVLWLLRRATSQS